MVRKALITDKHLIFIHERLTSQTGNQTMNGYGWLQ